MKKPLLIIKIKGRKFGQLHPALRGMETGVFNTNMHNLILSKMKKSLLFVAFVLLITSSLTAQVAINTTGDNPDPSAILDLQSTTKGFLVPRVTSAERNLIGTTQSGLLVYDLTTESFWYYDNTQAGWVDMGSGPGVTSINDLSDAISDDYSVFLGKYSGVSDDGTNNNTGVGSYSLFSVTSGANNVAVGRFSLGFTTTASNNIAIGYGAAYNNTTGYSNVALGTSSLIRNTNRSNLVAIGDSALFNNGNGAIYSYEATANTAVGSKALYANTRGYLNTALGFNALYSNTTGRQNTAIGYKSQELTTIGYNNTAIGDLSLTSNTTGYYNTAIGSNSMGDNTFGFNNTGVGIGSLRKNTEGDRNVGVGSSALSENLTGNDNTALGSYAGKGVEGNSVSGCVFIGYSAGENNTNDNKLFIDNSNTSTPLIGGDFSTNQVDINGTIKISGGSPGANKVLTSDADGLASWTTPTTYASSINDLSDAIYDNTSLFMGYLSGANDDGGNYNLGIGREALTTLTTGLHNTAVGYKALATCNSNDNTAVGINALRYTTTGTQNTSLGMNALQNNTTGSHNTGVGYEALKTNTEGSENTAFGQAALYANTSGAANAAFGFNANYHNTTGLENTACGENSLYNNTSGGGNVAIGYGALENNVTGHWNTAIGHSAYVASGSYLNSTAIGYNSPINGSNQIHLGNTSITEIKGQVSFTTYSDGRIKENVKENVKGLDFILKLRPVTYHINLDEENRILGITDKVNLPNKYDIEQVLKTGFIAQEVEAAAREVDYDFSGIQTPKNEHDLYGLSYAEFVVPLVKSVQELNEKLEKENAELRARIQRLEQLLNK